MKASKVQYTVKTEYSHHNAENIKTVMADLRRINNADIKYCSFMLEDQKTFVHFLITQTEEANKILTGLESFKKFLSELKASEPEIAPRVENLNLIGSSFDFFESEETKSAIRQFNLAFIEKNAELIENIISDNCVMEGATPAPDGMKISGYENCLAFWKELIDTPNAQFMPEKVSILADKAVIEWSFKWGNDLENHIRGVNIMTIQNGKITGAKGFVKGSLN